MNQNSMKRKKDMRTWKRVLDDDSLEAVWDDIEANSSEIDDVLKDME